ncbi:MAG: trigger factor [Deltaproteobacteria bacterium]|nr:trigger factor [Deltaproteobacteria bacterium]
MNYANEELSPVKRKVNVTVPKEEVNAALGATIAMYRRDADIKGFRKGKVPSKLIESRFQERIYHEATTDLINVHINDIMNELKLLPLGGIEMEDGGKLVRDEEFSYSFTFEVAPEFSLPEYRGLAVEEEEVAVSEDEISAVIDRIRDNVAVPSIVRVDRHPKPGDIVSIDFQGLENGEPIAGVGAQNFDLRLGQGGALPEFESVVMEMLPGQTKESDLTFPKDFVGESLAGKTVTMRITLNAIKEKNLPELSDDLARKAGGFESLEQLRKSISESYTNARKDMSKSVAQKTLLDAIKAQVDFELPQSLVEGHVNAKLDETRDKLERQGKSFASLGKSPEEIRAELKPEAEALVKSQLVLLAIAKQENLTVQPQEVESHLRRQAMSMGQDYNALRDYLEANNMIVPLKDKLLADKAMDLVYANAQVTRVPPASRAKDNEKAGQEETAASTENA